MIKGYDKKNDVREYLEIWRRSYVYEIDYEYDYDYLIIITIIVNVPFPYCSYSNFIQVCLSKSLSFFLNDHTSIDHSSNVNLT